MGRLDVNFQLFQSLTYLGHNWRLPLAKSRPSVMAPYLFIVSRIGIEKIRAIFLEFLSRCTTVHEKLK